MFVLPAEQQPLGKILLWSVMSKSVVDSRRFALHSDQFKELVEARLFLAWISRLDNRLYSF